MPEVLGVTDPVVDWETLPIHEIEEWCMIVENNPDRDHFLELFQGTPSFFVRVREFKAYCLIQGKPFPYEHFLT